MSKREPKVNRGRPDESFPLQSTGRPWCERPQLLLASGQLEVALGQHQSGLVSGRLRHLLRARLRVRPLRSHLFTLEMESCERARAKQDAPSSCHCNKQKQANCTRQNLRRTNTLALGLACSPRFSVYPCLLEGFRRVSQCISPLSFGLPKDCGDRRLVASRKRMPG